MRNLTEKILAAAFTVALCVVLPATAQNRRAISADEQAIIQADRAVFQTAKPSVSRIDSLLDPDFTWTDSSGGTRNRSEIVQAVKSGQGLPLEAAIGHVAAAAYIEGKVAVLQKNSGKLYVLRIWVKRDSGWRLLVYQAVASGAPASNKSEKEECDNPCKTVPFEPQSEDQRQVIQAYQAVERAVTAQDSAAWGAHIADEFFAVTSNSDRPVDKATRMAGLDKQKVGGIAPFPLVSARMFQFGGAMVMTSRQQPKNGLPLHVTRIWFKRNGSWLEAFSYQTTIQERGSAQ
jgi:hypothetical protein